MISRHYRDNTVVSLDGHEFKLWRTKHKMSQNELAIHLDISKTTVSSWEREISIPTMEVIEKLQEKFPDIKKAIKTKKRK